MMWPPETKPNLLIVADPPEAQTLTPATTTQALHILIRTDCDYRSLRLSFRATSRNHRIHSNYQYWIDLPLRDGASCS
jgi:hypothetical protein